MPHFEVAARLPCFAIVTPAPAAMNAAVVDTLNVPAKSPPVPTMSTASGFSHATCTPAARIADAAASRSSAVMPFSW